MNVLILSEVAFIESYPRLKNRKDLFFISILDPDNKKKSLFRERGNYKTWKFYDLEYDIGNYKSITFDQAKEIRDFIVENLDKTLVVHCAAGVARSGAIGEFYWELLGGSYKDLLEKYSWISPNGKVLAYLRNIDKLDNRDFVNFI
jgi:protein tyrosine/serine phosphatase